MANQLVLTTPNYTQAEKNFFITDAVIGLDTLNAGLMYIASDVKNDVYTFPKVTSSIVLQNRASIPVSSGATTLDNKNVNLGAFMGYSEFEPSIFENHWHVDQISAKLLERGLPVTFENYLTGVYTNAVLAPIETQIWMGSTTFTGATNNNRFVDGIVKQCLTPATTAVTISASVVTAANIIAKMEAMKNAIPKALLSDPARYKKLKYILSVEDGQKYEEALVSTAFKNQDTTERGLNRYKGYDIVVVAGLAEHTMFFGHADGTVQSNLHMAVSTVENMNFDLNRLQANSTLWFYKLLFKYGVGVAKPYELVMHTTKVIGDFTGA